VRNNKDYAASLELRKLYQVILVEFCGSFRAGLRAYGEWTGSPEAFESAVETAFQELNFPSDFVNEVKRMFLLAGEVDAKKASAIPISVDDNGEDEDLLRRLLPNAGTARPARQGTRVGCRKKERDQPRSFERPGRAVKGKGHAAFATWPLFKPATTYSPTHFRVQYNRPCGA
jgi:hypothetical protein